jgi:hypothetical protein
MHGGEKHGARCKRWQGWVPRRRKEQRSRSPKSGLSETVRDDSGGLGLALLVLLLFLVLLVLLLLLGGRRLALCRGLHMKDARQQPYSTAHEDGIISGRRTSAFDFFFLGFSSSAAGAASTSIDSATSDCGKDRCVSVLRAPTQTRSTSRPTDLALLLLVLLLGLDDRLDGVADERLDLGQDRELALAALLALLLL